MKFEWAILENEIDGNQSGVPNFLNRMDSKLRGEGLPLEGFSFLNSAQEMLKITREIEDSAAAFGSDSSMYVGFQNIDKLASEYDRYQNLISKGVSIHAFGTGDVNTWTNEACTTWNSVPKSISKVENQWILVSNSPTPIAFVGWEVSRELFGEGRLSDPGKMFEGFVSSDTRVVENLLAHLENVKSHCKMDLKKISSSKSHEKTYRKIMLVTENKTVTSNGGKILGFDDHVLDFCQRSGAETILYDISACSYFVKPVPAESDSLLRNVIAKETIVNLGRSHLAAQGQIFENSGIKTSFLLPEKNGFQHLVDRAIREEVDLIVMDDYYSSPGLMDRLAGNSLSNLDHTTEIEVILYKQMKTQISVTSGS
tara:strand:- start:218 stop:1324 length:1107 start_codon:yes stop_codon:yes gene_type:complete